MAFDLPGAESTSAELRRLHTELAEVRAAAGIDADEDRHVRLADRVRLIRDGRADAVDRLVEVLGERNKARAAFDLAEELRLKTRAELVSAQTELDAVRIARDRLGRLLADAVSERDEANATISRLAGQLAEAWSHIQTIERTRALVDSQPEGAPPA